MKSVSETDVTNTNGHTIANIVSLPHSLNSSDNQNEINR